MIPSPLGWVNNDAEIKVTKQCKIKFAISVDFINEVELDVVPIDMCRVVFGSSYMYMMDVIFMQQKMNTTWSRMGIISSSMNIKVNQRYHKFQTRQKVD